MRSTSCPLPTAMKLFRGYARTSSADAMGETPFEQIWKDFKIIWPYLFCIPFGWRVTGAFKQNAPLVLLNNTWAMLAFYGVQIAIAFTLGIPCFIYMFVKMLLAQRKLSKTKNNQ